MKAGWSSRSSVPVQVLRDGVELAIGGVRERSVLAVLLGQGRPVPAERLIDAMWERPPRSARAQVHNLISKLRTRPYGDLIITHPIGYALRLGPHELDAVEFRSLVKAGRGLIGEGDDTAAMELLAAATSLWRGPALAGVSGGLADAARQALEQERLVAAEELFEAQMSLGQHAQVIAGLPPFLAENPYRERLHELHMTALVAAGRRADALAAYRAVYRCLADELGVEPGARLMELEQQILRGEVSTAIRRTEVARPVPRELPAVAAALTGREKLITAIETELRQERSAASAVAVLTGQGGIGKTALAIAVGHVLAASFPDGQLFADLRGSHPDPADPHEVVGHFLRALGVNVAQLPADRTERAGLYRSLLAHRRMLVVLDDASREEQVRPLLPGDVGCATVITSRRQLGGLIAVARFPVPTLSRADALELLARIVGKQRVAGEPEAALEIVEGCGHLPLATCIAATRLAVRPDWTLDDFRRRITSERRRLDELAIGDLDVRASIGLSYQALEPALQQLFRKLGLIAAPDWPLWVAGVLSGKPVDEMIDRLIDVHLVEPLGRDAVGQERFRLHDLVAEFAREVALGIDDVQVRAASDFAVADAWLGLASSADPLVGHGMSYGDGVHASAVPPAEALRVAREGPREWFEIERASLVCAVQTACALRRADLAGGFALRLFGFFAIGGHREDEENTLRAALALARESGNDDWRLRLVPRLFAVCVVRDRNSELPGLAAEHLSLARQLADRAEETFALKQSGLAARRCGRLAEAAQWNEKAIASCGKDTPSDVLTLTLAGGAVLYWEAGQPERALPFAERMLQVQRTLGVTRTTGMRLLVYADVLIDLGRLDDAERTLREAMQCLGGVNDVAGHAYAQHRLADIDIGRGAWDRAAIGLRQARAAVERLGDRNSIADVLRSEADLAIAGGEAAAAIAPLQQAVVICRGLHAPLELARTLARLGLALSGLDEHKSRHCWEEVWAILAQIDLDDRCLRLPKVLPVPRVEGFDDGFRAGTGTG